MWPRRGISFGGMAVFMRGHTAAKVCLRATPFLYGKKGGKEPSEGLCPLNPRVVLSMFFLGTSIHTS